jgi:hypothetical protein
MVSYILTITFLECRQDDKTLNQTVASIPRTQSALNLFVRAILIC